MVLPFAFRNALPFDLDTGGWPRALHKSYGKGLVTVRFWDEIGEPASESTQ